MKSILKLWNKTSFLYRMIGGVLIGTACGIFFKDIVVLKILAELFIGALKAIAPYLVFFLVCASLAKASESIGPKIGKTVILYLTTTLLAALIAVIASTLFPVSLTLGETATGTAPSSIGEVIVEKLSSIVDNPVKALAEGNYLSILFWAIALGLCIRKISNDKVSSTIGHISDVLVKLVSAIISFAPIGIMGLVYVSVSENGTGIFVEYGKLIALIVGSILVSALVVNPIIIGIMIRRNPYPLVLTCIKESGFTAFFTRSSAANIPINMALCEKLGLDREFYSISISLGATINMNGAAISITTITLAISHTLGMDFGFAATLYLCIIASLAACGVSGVAGGSYLLIPLSCALFGIGNDIAMQGVYIGFIIGVISDAFETAHNSSSDAIMTAAVQYRSRMIEKKEVNYMGKFK